MSDNPYAAPQSDVERSTSAGELASRGKRLLAVIVDAIIVSVITVPLYFVFGIWSSLANGSFVTLLIAGLLSFGVWVAINYVPLEKTGQTIGKKLLGIQIVGVDSRQILPALDIILKRMLPITIAANIPFIGRIAGLVDALMIFRADRRCGHDLIAGTIVVDYAG